MFYSMPNLDYICNLLWGLLAINKSEYKAQRKIILIRNLFASQGEKNPKVINISSLKKK